MTSTHAPDYTPFWSEVYNPDMLGSSRTIVQAGQTSACYDADFYPFGGERDVTASCAENYKFEGKERDSETQNDDFGARYYSWRVGRWLSADWSAVPTPVPYANLANPQTLNLYAMASDNPETFADLDGHGTDPVPPPPPPTTPPPPPPPPQNNAAQPRANGSTSIVTVSATSSGPGMYVGGAIGELIDPVAGGLPGAVIGSMFGVGGNVSYVPSTDSWFAGPTVSFTPAILGGNGVSASDVIVPAGQKANSIANGTSYSVSFQPKPLTGATVTKSPGSGPPVAGPAVGTKVPLSFSASHNFDVTRTVRSLTNMVNNSIKTVKSWF